MLGGYIIWLVRIVGSNFRFQVIKTEQKQSLNNASELEPKPSLKPDLVLEEPELNLDWILEFKGCNR